MAKEYVMILKEISDGETQEIEMFNVHPLLFWEVKGLIDDHLTDPNLWVSKKG